VMWQCHHHSRTEPGERLQHAPMRQVGLAKASHSRTCSGKVSVAAMLISQ
jgi:hypothetical protein